MPQAPPPAYAILVEGHFDVHDAKTACSLLRYAPKEVAAVIDSTWAGRTTEEVVGLGGPIPVVASLEEALAHRPNRLLVGIAAPGGRLPEQWLSTLMRAVDAGLDLYSGLHTFLTQDAELVERARARGVRLVDLRAVPGDLSTPVGDRQKVEVPVILTVGSDCNVGKMTVLWQLRREAGARGLSYGVAATGQTGVLLEGRGMAMDRVISDFLAGAAERLTVEASRGRDLVLVEGQGSLLHPFFSGVTLGLLHGTQPDAMILCHTAGREEVRHCPGLKIPPLSRLVAIYEEAASWVRPCPVLGVALATHHLNDEQARAALDRARVDTGLPCEDTVRFPTGSLLEACEELRRRGP